MDVWAINQTIDKCIDGPKIRGIPLDVCKAVGIIMVTTAGMATNASTSIVSAGACSDLNANTNKEVDFGENLIFSVGISSLGARIMSKARSWVAIEGKDTMY